MTTITAETILSSQHSEVNKRLTTLRLTYPRWIHAEFMTHRVFSRNASSSRAIPVERVIKQVRDNPAVPLFWGANQKGMQAGQECNERIEEWWQYPRTAASAMHTVDRETAWLTAMNAAVCWAEAFAKAGYHKQIVNRLIEPFSHITVVVSSTEWDNFLALRDHSAAEPHIQMLAREIKRELEKPAMQILPPGNWHLPFVRAEDCADLPFHDGATWVDDLLKLSVARCASTSYNTVEGFEMTRERAVDLHDKLRNANPIHASPFEHVAQADALWDGYGRGYCNPEMHRNFVGFKQYRAMIGG